jgi:integrase/recombinase XerD
MKIRKLDRRDRIEWVVDYYEGAKRVRRWFKSKAEAEAHVDTIRGQHRNAGQAWIELEPDERADLMLVASEARQRGVTLRQVWEAFKSGKLDAQPIKRCTLRQAIDETINWRRKENLRERYLTELKGYLKRFAAGRMEMFVDQISVEALQTWFDENPTALSTRRANAGRLGSMFDVCWKLGYVKENPCLRLPTIKIRQGETKILTVEQAEALLRACHESTPDFLPYIVLGMFAGIRPEELEKLQWRHISLEHQQVHVDETVAKTGQNRYVPLEPVAMEWLKRCDNGKPDEPIAPFSDSTFKRYRRKVKVGAGIAWTQDILRKTAASYWIEKTDDAGKVTKWLGHSLRIQNLHYKKPVVKANCAAFWALTPAAVLDKGKQRNGGERKQKATPKRTQSVPRAG